MRINMIRLLLRAVVAIAAVLFVILIMASSADLFGQNNGAMLPWARPQFVTAAGAVVANGFVCTTATGTTTALATYSEQTLTTANANPITLNASGLPVSGANEIRVFIQAESYRISIYAAGTGNTCNGTTVGALVRQMDNVYDLALLFTEDFNPLIVDNVHFCAQYAGANAGAKITACIAAIPAAGGTADARGLEGAQTLGTLTVTASNINLLLGAATFTGNIVWRSNGGSIRGINTKSTSLTATTGVPLTIGDSEWPTSGTVVDNVHVSGMTVTGIASTSAIAVYRAPYSRLDNLVVNGPTTTGLPLIKIQASDDRFIVDNIIIGALGAGSIIPSIGLSIEDGSNQAIVTNVTCQSEEICIQTFNSFDVKFENLPKVNSSPAAATTGIGIAIRVDRCVPAWLTWLPADYAHGIYVNNVMFEQDDTVATSNIVDVYVGYGPIAVASGLCRAAQELVGTYVTNLHSIQGLPSGGTRYAVTIDYAEQTTVRDVRWSGQMTSMVNITANAQGQFIEQGYDSIYNQTGVQGLTAGILVVTGGTDTIISRWIGGLPAGIQYFTNGVGNHGTEPRVIFYETDRGTNDHIWDWDLQGGTIALRTRTDADGAGVTAISVARTSSGGTALGNMALSNFITILPNEGSGGSIGVNRTTPSSRTLDLLVSGSAPTLAAASQVVGLAQNSAAAGDNAYWDIISGTAGQSILGLGDNADDDIGAVIYNNSNNSMILRTNNGTQLTINSAGQVQFGVALVALGGGAGAALGTIGGSGPTVAAQNTWKEFIDSTGAAFWVPVWK